MRLLAFIVALLLLAGTVDPTRGWLIALVVLTGLAAFRPRFWGSLSVRPAIDVRLAAFVFAILLLAGTIEPTRDWLIGLTIVTGVAMVCPKLLCVDLFGERERHRTAVWYSGRRRSRWFDDDDRWGRDAQDEFDEWGGKDRGYRHRDKWNEV